MIDRSKVKVGDPLPGYRFKPGECIVNSRLLYESRRRKCTQKELDDLKMLVVEVGIVNAARRGVTVFCTTVRREGTKSHGIRLIIGGQKLKSNPILSAATTLESDLRPVFDVTGSAGPPGECDQINRLSRFPVEVRDQHRFAASCRRGCNRNTRAAYARACWQFFDWCPFMA